MGAMHAPLTFIAQHVAVEAVKTAHHINIYSSSLIRIILHSWVVKERRFEVAPHPSAALIQD
jgi:hypothetical protein